MLNNGWLLALLTILAVARLTHLATTDYITDRPRRWIDEHAPTSIAYLVQCPWCLSIYLGGGTAAAVYLWHGRWFITITLLGLAASYLTGILEQLSGLINAVHDRAELQSTPNGPGSPE